jgi:hypothetical protein
MFCCGSKMFVTPKRDAVPGINCINPRRLWRNRARLETRFLVHHRVDQQGIKTVALRRLGHVTVDLFVACGKASEGRAYT